MDRSSFLSCFPYLAPSSLGGWPPRRTIAAAGSPEAPSSTRHEVLMRDGYQVSLEIPHRDDEPTAVAAESRNSSAKGSSSEECTRKGRSSSSGPLFFTATGNNDDESTKKSSTDPAMCPIELCLEFSEREASLHPFAPSSGYTGSNNNSSFGTDSSTPPRRNVLEHCSAIFLRIDGRTYTADWSQLQQMYLERSPSKKAGTTTPAGGGSGSFQTPRSAGEEEYLMESGGAARKQPPHKRRPPSLLLVFPSLLLRIFALPHTSASFTDQDPHETLLYELQTVQRRLAEALTQLQQYEHSSCSSSSFADGNSGALSPSSTSHSGATNSDSQQRQFASFKSTLKSMEEGADSGEKDHKKADNNGTSSRFKRRRTAYNQCRSNIKALQALLEAPVSSLSAVPSAAAAAAASIGGGGEKKSEALGEEDVISKDELQSLLSPLLTGTADQLAASYVDPAQVAQEWQQQEQTQSAALSKSLEPLLDQFFPRRKPRRSRRGVTQTTTSPQSTAGPPNVPETIASVQELLQQFQRDTAQRHELLLLPTRVRKR